MLIECPRCVARVDARVLGEQTLPATDETDPYVYFFLQCPSCEDILLAGAEADPDPNNETGLFELQRLWPKPNETLLGFVPAITRRAIEDAQKCYSTGVYSACAVMCGKALEAICVEKTGKKTLAEGLKELRNLKIIDDRLFAWGEALRKERNIGAHASEELTTQEDARDILDFAMAICEYVYFLTEKYEEYLERKSKRGKKK